ncbi:MAG: hypothetical protein JWO06_2014 [Bacteroidota bacterium]|nr:hypothetical protein [Bacteroidota bacterium]
MEPELFKKKIASINRQLATHGGNENKIKAKSLTPDRVRFFEELFTHLPGYFAIGKERLDSFFEDDPIHQYPTMNVHKIELPENFTGKEQWTLVVGDNYFGGPEMVFEIKEWEVLDETFVG